MRNGVYYLNNAGTRWACYDNGKKEKHTFYTIAGRPVIRTLIEYFSFGNFGGGLAD